MKHPLIIITPIIFILLSSSASLAQTEKPDSAATPFKKVIQKSIKELNESHYDKNLQRKYAQIYYDYYLNHPDEKYSKFALATAFKFWGNLGAVDKVDSVIAHLDYHSKSWRYFLTIVPNAYANSEHNSIEDAVTLFEKLTNKLTDPKSKSLAYCWLAEYYHSHNDTAKLKKAARAMINLDANKEQVKEGLGYLYELKSLNIGQRAPSFQAETVQGQSISVPQDNKITLLEFWATWCGPCMGEIPHLKSIQSKYSADDLQIIGISLDTNPKKVEQFIRSKKMSWPQIIQPKEWDGEITKKYNVLGIPATYIISKNGKIIAKDLRGEELEKEIANLMNQ